MLLKSQARAGQQEEDPVDVPVPGTRPGLCKGTRSRCPALQQLDTPSFVDRTLMRVQLPPPTGAKRSDAQSRSSDDRKLRDRLRIVRKAKCEPGLAH